MGSRKTLVIFILLSLTYIGLTLGIPPDSASLTKYNLSVPQIKLLLLSIVVPLLLIWAIAYFGYVRFSKYALTVQDSKEGEGWNFVVKGLLALALWLPLNANIGSLGSYIYHRHPDLTPTVVIITNYTNLIIILVAFILLFRGANCLVKSIEKPLPNTFRSLGMVVLLAASGLFAYLSLSSANKTIPVDATTPAAYYLPDWLLVLTIIIPYIFIFYLGLRVFQDIYLYRTHVKGALYKEALKFLARGIGFVVLSLLALRYLASLTAVFHSAALKLVLFILYILILLIGAGYVLVALGAKRLQKLEEV